MDDVFDEPLAPRTNIEGAKTKLTNTRSSSVSQYSEGFESLSEGPEFFPKFEKTEIWKILSEFIIMLEFSNVSDSKVHGIAESAKTSKLVSINRS